MPGPTTTTEARKLIRVKKEISEVKKGDAAFRRAVYSFDPLFDRLNPYFERRARSRRL